MKAYALFNFVYGEHGQGVESYEFIGVIMASDEPTAKWKARYEDVKYDKIIELKQIDFTDVYLKA